MIQPSLFLRRALLADAIVSGASGALLALVPTPLASLFNLPQPLLMESGLIFIVYAALVGWLGTRARVNVYAVDAVIAANAACTLIGLGLLLSPWIAPNALGIAFVVIMGMTTGVFAELQYIGLRRSGASVTVA